jgi:hypothetical protein
LCAALWQRQCIQTCAGNKLYNQLLGLILVSGKHGALSDAGNRQQSRFNLALLNSKALDFDL